MVYREGSKKKVKVCSLNILADPPPSTKVWSTYCKKFLIFFWLLICFTPYKIHYGHKKVQKNYKILEKNTKEYQ